MIVRLQSYVRFASRWEGFLLMARVYGFRVFVVQVFENRKKGKTPLDVSWGSPTVSKILELLDEAHRQDTYFFEPRVVPANGEPAKPTASLTVDAPLAVRDGFVHVEISAGEVGYHRHATGRGEQPVGLQKKSAEAGHFVALVFPKAADDRFLVVAQTNRRRDPVLRLLARLRDIASDEKKADSAAQEAAREAAREAGTKLPPLKPIPRLVFDHRQAADDSYLDEIVSGATKASAIFTGYAPSSRGTAEQVERTLRINILRSEDMKKSSRLGSRWMRGQRKGEPTSQSDAVVEMGALLSDDIISDDELEDYDKVAVSLKDGNGETTSIAVDNLRDIFTYPVADGAPDETFFYGKVSKRLDTIALQEGIEIDSIDSLEVSECLEDLT